MKNPIIFSIIALAITLTANTACSDDNDSSTSSGTSQKTIDSLNKIRIADSLQDLSQTVENLFIYTDANGKKRVKASILNSRDSLTSYIGVNTTDSARMDFEERFVPSGITPTKNADGSESYTVDTYGTVKFTPEEGTITGTIHVNMINIPSVKTINYVPVSLWPKNGTSKFVRTGTYQNKKSSRYYFCTSEPNSGRPGYLVCFYSPDSRNNSIYKDSCIDKDAVVGMNDLYSKNPSALYKRLSAYNDIVNKDNMSAPFPLGSQDFSNLHGYSTYIGKIEKVEDLHFYLVYWYWSYKYKYDLSYPFMQKHKLYTVKSSYTVDRDDNKYDLMKNHITQFWDIKVVTEADDNDWVTIEVK